MGFRTGADLIGTYANRPAASAANSGYYYYATNVGVRGCLFRSTGSAWVQAAPCRIAEITATVEIATTTETSIFGALNLPDGCAASGAAVYSGLLRMIGGPTGGSAHADLVYKLYFNSTLIATSNTYTAEVNWDNLPSDLFFTMGATDTTHMVANLSGLTGVPVPFPRYTPNAVNITPASVTQTTGYPELKLTQSNRANSPKASYMAGSYMDANGLV